MSMSLEVVKDIHYITSSLILLALLSYISLKDIEKNYVPEWICRTSLIAGLMNIFILELYYSNEFGYLLLCERLISSIIILTLMCFISFTSKKITSINCLGLGDSKLAAVGGAWLGLEGIIEALCITFLCSGFISLILKLLRLTKDYQTYPFTPFISIGIFYVWINRGFSF